jgi:hypothetical protein
MSVVSHVVSKELERQEYITFRSIKLNVPFSVCIKLNFIGFGKRNKFNNGPKQTRLALHIETHNMGIGLASVHILDDMDQIVILRGRFDPKINRQQREPCNVIVCSPKVEAIICEISYVAAPFFVYGKQMDVTENIQKECLLVIDKYIQPFIKRVQQNYLRFLSELVHLHGLYDNILRYHLVVYLC